MFNLSADLPLGAVRVRLQAVLQYPARPTPRSGTRSGPALSAVG